MTLWKCMNPRCPAHRKRFESDTGACPECGAHLSKPQTPVHYMVPADGPIYTGLGGRMIACDPRRDTLPESCTASRDAVTCPRCTASTIFVEDERDRIDNHNDIIERQHSITQGRI